MANKNNYFLIGIIVIVAIVIFGIIFLNESQNQKEIESKFANVRINNLKCWINENYFEVGEDQVCLSFDAVVIGDNPPMIGSDFTIDVQKNELVDGEFAKLSIGTYEEIDRLYGAGEKIEGFRACSNTEPIRRSDLLTDIIIKLNQQEKTGSYSYRGYGSTKVYQGSFSDCRIDN